MQLRGAGGQAARRAEKSSDFTLRLRYLASKSRRFARGSTQKYQLYEEDLKVALRNEGVLHATVRRRRAGRTLKNPNRRSAGSPYEYSLKPMVSSSSRPKRVGEYFEGPNFNFTRRISTLGSKVRKRRFRNPSIRVDETQIQELRTR